MKTKHVALLNLIFQHPVSGNIVWKEVELMLQSFGAELSEGRGSRIRVILNEVRAVFHRPHPRKEMDKGAVMSLRRFLIETGITP